MLNNESPDWHAPLNYWSQEQLFNAIFSLRSFGRKAFPDGLFPSQRWHSFGYSRDDNSAYFSAGILFNLLRVQQMLPLKQVQKVTHQIEDLAPIFDLYQNKTGRDTYNFWQTKPPGHFSNGRLLGKWEFFRPPDDADDSVMIYSVLNKPIEKRRWLLSFIDAHANGVNKRVRHMPKPYSEFKAWTTFFVRDMPAGFDVSVMSNLLGFAFETGLPLSSYAYESIQFLEHVVKSGDWIKRPELISPYYPFPFVIAYHLSRLISDYPKRTEMDELKKALQIALSKVSNQQGFSALLQFIANKNCHLSAQFPQSLNVREIEKAPFFVLPLSLEFHGAWAKWLARKKMTHLRFSCPAYNLTLALEASLLDKKES